MTYQGHYVGSHTHSFGGSGNASPPTWQQVLVTPQIGIISTPPEEKKMTIAEQVAKERHEAIERKRLEQLFSDWEERLGGAVVVTWMWGDKRYAAVLNDDGWFGTKRDWRYPLNTQDFIAHLIELGVGLTEMQVLT